MPTYTEIAQITTLQASLNGINQALVNLNAGGMLTTFMIGSPPPSTTTTTTTTTTPTTPSVPMYPVNVQVPSGTAIPASLAQDLLAFLNSLQSSVTAELTSLGVTDIPT
jgi:hypothetical protein